MAEDGASCGDSCGWAAAVVAMLAFGSFGVPIKSDASNSVDIDPLVFQTYKTIMCFLTSWIVLLLGQDFTFTPWGIVSGLCWVPGGVAFIYGVRNAGLAVIQGISATFIVLVSFIWGIFIFQEGVRSTLDATGAVGLMCIGLWGMSYYSSPEVLRHELGPDSSTSNNENTEEENPSANNIGYLNVQQEDESQFEDELQYPGNTTEIEVKQLDYVDVYGYRICRRKMGLAAAVFNGVWGGSIMAPMHYSKGNTGGLGYVISFAIGASIVTLFLWIMRYAYHVNRTGSFVKGFEALPSFHVRVMWLAGGTAGTLWSIGNICSMISVEYLGEGVGYSVVQSAMLVSGMWGIFWFKEVIGIVPRIQWLLAASITILSILWLSYEHRK
mmetsp:Transcript_1581/g.2831  ORF Transcript_1581/g.2831 Transcript_1581/m.2831 type:complete len:383 (-) Transcript_1581:160-1308(-)